MEISELHYHDCRVGQTIHTSVYTIEPYKHQYIQCMYGILSTEITIHTVIYGVHIQFWPALQNCTWALSNSSIKFELQQALTNPCR
jgi:hypothetical protein